MAGVVERLQFLLTMDSSGAIKGFKNIGSVASQELGRAESSMAKVSHSMNRVGGGSLAIAGVMGRALFSVASGFQNSAITAGVFSDATRLSMEQSSRWVEVAGDMGIKSGDLQTAFTKMERTLGTSPEKFKQLGVEVARTSAGSVDAEGTFLNLVDRLNSMPDPAMRAKAAADILGRGWQANAELISQGSEQIRRSLAGVSSSQVFSSSDRQKAEQMRKAMEDLADAGEELRNNLARGAVPVLSQLADVTSAAVGAFAKLDDVSNGSLGAFTAIATTAIGAGGAMSLIAGQAMKAKDTLITFDKVAQKNVLTGIGKLTVGFAALSVALTVGTMAWSQITKKKREAAARTAEVSDALAIEVVNLIRSKNAVDAARVGFEALSTTLTTVGKDGNKTSTAMAQLGLTNADSAQVLADFKMSGDKGYETLRKLALGAGLSASQSDLLGRRIADNDVQFSEFAFKSWGLSEAQYDVARALMEVRDQAEKTDIFKDMTDATWKMASSSTAGQEALKRVNDEIGSGTDKATVTKRYQMLSQALYGMGDAAGATGEDVQTLAEMLEELANKTSSNITDSWMGAIQLPRQWVANQNKAAHASEEWARKTISAYDKVSGHLDALVNQDEALTELKTKQDEYTEAVETYGKNSPEARSALLKLTKGMQEAAETSAAAVPGFEKLSEAQQAAFKSRFVNEWARNMLANVDKDSPLYFALQNLINLIAQVGLLQSVGSDMTNSIQLSDAMKTSLGWKKITKGSDKGKWKTRDGTVVGATGGIVTQPTMALIGEAGPEMVVPLNRTPGSSPLPSGIGSGTNITINVTAPEGKDPYAFGQAIVSALKTYVRTNGKISGVAA